MTVSRPLSAPALPPLTGASTHADAGLPQQLGDLLGHLRAGGGEVDVDAQRRPPGQLPGDLGHHVRRRQADQHELRGVRDPTRAIAQLRARLGQRGDGIRSRVVDAQRVAGLHQSPGHRAAHRPQPDEADPARRAAGAHAVDCSAARGSITPRAVSAASAVRIASIAAGTPQ